MLTAMIMSLGKQSLSCSNVVVLRLPASDSRSLKCSDSVNVDHADSICQKAPDICTGFLLFSES